MAFRIQLCTAISAVLTVLSLALYMWHGLPVLLSLTITAATVFYHLAMRLAVGSAVNALLHNRVDASLGWFRPRAWERTLYRLLRVRFWRRHMPTYDPAAFDLTRHTPRELLGASCQAELVHEIILPLSLLPIAAAPFLGAFPVFLITSLLAALFDLLFVIMQRHLRPTLLRAVQRTEASPPASPAKSSVKGEPL